MATQESWGKLWSIGTRNWKIVSTLKLQSSTSQTSIKYLCVVMSRHIISLSLTKLSRSQKPEDIPTNGRWGASCRSGWRSSWTHPSTSATGKTMNRSSSSWRHHRLETIQKHIKDHKGFPGFLILSVVRCLKLLLHLLQSNGISLVWRLTCDTNASFLSLL